jgi:PEP-CTERM motif
MPRLAVAAASLIVLLAFPLVCDAGTITYSIQNYPADQNDASLSGTITTDGTIGALASSDILSWSWTVTPAGGTSYTLSSSEAGAYATIDGLVVATQNEITVSGYAPTIDSENYVELISVFTIGLYYFRNDDVSQYDALLPSGYTWLTNNPSMGGTDPWVIATASVPEPPTLTLAGLGAVAAFWYGLARTRRARCDVASA